MHTSNIYIGVDPGLSGGICAINEDGTIRFVTTMPTISVGTKKEINVPALVTLLDQFAVKMVGIETQHAMPKQGVSSMFKIGKGYGILIGILAALKKPYAEIRANEWQKQMFMGLPKSDTKDLSKKIAQQMYPTYDFKATSRCTNLHDGMTDACMIANYIKTKYV